jgi:hypothetical protein
MHNHSKSNSGQIGQVIAMGGSEKTQDFVDVNIGQHHHH